MRTRGRVLIVDDDEAFLAALREVLQQAGFAVEASVCAGGALDFLWECWDTQPDVILLDVWMPTVDGVGFAEAYRLMPVAHAPIVVMSGDAEVQEYAVRIQADGVLSKPFELDDLLERIARVSAPPAAPSPAAGGRVASKPDATDRGSLRHHSM